MVGRIVLSPRRSTRRRPNPEQRQTTVRAPKFLLREIYVAGLRFRRNDRCEGVY